MSPFFESNGCPFCREHGSPVFSLNYRDTAEASASIPDAAGQILECKNCGVHYPSLGYDMKLFASLYEKTLTDLAFFDETVLQKVRRAALPQLVKLQSRDPLSSALQIPFVTFDLSGKSALDVGCGFGEFSTIMQQLGAKVTATEVIGKLAEMARANGIDCRHGELETIDFGQQRFDLILFRAVLYRTMNPPETLRIAKSLLAPGGVISVLDPGVDAEGVRYFAGKQFPQGRYYITDAGKFGRMLQERLGLRIGAARQIYGRPDAPLQKVRIWGNIKGIAELVVNNTFGRKPYMLSYLLTDAAR